MTQCLNVTRYWTGSHKALSSFLLHYLAAQVQSQGELRSSLLVATVRSWTVSDPPTSRCSTQWATESVPTLAATSSCSLHILSNGAVAVDGKSMMTLFLSWVYALIVLVPFAGRDHVHYQMFWWRQTRIVEDKTQIRHRTKRSRIGCVRRRILYSWTFNCLLLRRWEVSNFKLHIRHISNARKENVYQVFDKSWRWIKMTLLRWYWPNHSRHFIGCYLLQTTNWRNCPDTY